MHVVSTNYNICLVTYQAFLSKAENFGLEMNTEHYSKFGILLIKQKCCLTIEIVFKYILWLKCVLNDGCKEKHVDAY